MNYWGFILFIIFACNTSSADLVEARGAVKRKHTVERAIDIDDVIRAEEDPNFAQYLIDRERKKQSDSQSAANYEKQRRTEAAAHEKAQAQFLREKNSRRVADESALEEQYQKQQEAWEQRQEKLQREYVKNQEILEEKRSRERIARFQKAFSPQRMPASQK